MGICGWCVDAETIAWDAVVWCAIAHPSVLHTTHDHDRTVARASDVKTFHQVVKAVAQLETFA